MNLMEAILEFLPHDLEKGKVCRGLKMSNTYIQKKKKKMAFPVTFQVELWYENCPSRVENQHSTTH